MTGGTLPSARQSKRTEKVPTSTVRVSCSLGRGRTKAGEPPRGERGRQRGGEREDGEGGRRESRERDRGEEGGEYKYSTREPTHVQ